MSQLGIVWTGDSVAANDWHKILDEMGRVVSKVTLKEFAHANGVSSKDVSKALSHEDNGRYPRAEWLPYLVRKDPTQGLAEALVAPAGLGVTKPVQMTPEERLTRLEQALAENLGPEIRRALFEKAYRR